MSLSGWPGRAGQWSKAELIFNIFGATELQAFLIM